MPERPTDRTAVPPNATVAPCGSVVMSGDPEIIETVRDAGELVAVPLELEASTL